MQTDFLAVYFNFLIAISSATNIDLKQALNGIADIEEIELTDCIAP